MVLFLKRVKIVSTKEGEVVRYLARSLPLQQRQFLLWPVTLLHVIDSTSPLYNYTPQDFSNNRYVPAFEAQQTERWKLYISIRW